MAGGQHTLPLERAPLEVEPRLVPMPSPWLKSVKSPDAAAWMEQPEGQTSSQESGLLAARAACGGET